MIVEISKKPPIILFDGVCNLCNGAVNFIIDRDKRQQFHFASLQSQAGQDLLTRHGLPTDYLHSLVLVMDEKVSVKKWGRSEHCASFGRDLASQLRIYDLSFSNSRFFL